MTIDDLVPLGKLSRSKRSDKEFLLFQPMQNFEPEFFKNKDIFLLFKDHSVRYVTIEDISEDRNIWLKIEEKDVIKEVIDAGSAMICKPADEIDDHFSEKDRVLTGMKIICDGKLVASVSAVEYYGAHDVIHAVDNDGKEFMIPDVPDYVVKKDYDDLEITVKNIEQFREL